jgi:succinate dehydrogenase flavin-adding protein (antitoxin of CptAB toxin-antitoxin module)
MLELDELLLRYMQRRYESAAAGEKAAFEALLALPDPELVGYLLLGHSPESPALASVVRSILGDAAR